MTSLISEEPEIPKHLVCPITNDLMKNPVITNGGQTYERNAIEKWMKLNKTDPITRDPITTLIPNFSIKSLCEEFKNKKEFFVNEELKETSEDLKKKKAEIKKNKEALKKLKEEEDAKRIKELKKSNPLPPNYCINSNVYSTTTTTTTTITSNSIPDENGNINCTNCVGCTNCIGCTNCRNCDGCTGCTNCKYCTDCTGCVNCNRCENCTGCTNCLMCYSCVEVSKGHNLRNCSNRYYC